MKCMACKRIELPTKPGLRHLPAAHVTLAEPVEPCNSLKYLLREPALADAIAKQHILWQSEEMWEL